MYDVTMLRLPEAVPSINQVWASEPRDFTPWLAEHLEVLDVLGLGRLVLVETEKVVPGTDRALDVLAARPGGGFVAIENQFSPLDHDHLTRGMAYAVGLQASTLVLLAGDHHSEFRSVARYLNELAGRSEAAQRIGIYLVTLQVERVEQYLIPRVGVVESPNGWDAVPDSDTTVPYVASLEEFLTQASPSVVQAATDLTRWWQTIGGRARINRQSVSLDRPNPGTAEPLSYLVLYTSGSWWLNRGAIIDAGVVPPGRVDEFDRTIAEAIPTLRRGENGYYLVDNGPVNVDGLRRIIAWIDRV